VGRAHALEDPEEAQLSLVQKLKLYNGKTLPGFTEDNIKELRKEANREGMEGISPATSRTRSRTPRQRQGRRLRQPVHGDERAGGRAAPPLAHHQRGERKNYRDLLGLVKQEYEDIVKNEVQRAISADEEAIAKLCANYIDNIKAYTQREKVKNRYTGHYEEPDERLMRSIEEKIDIPESRKDDFRREIMNYIGALAIEGRSSTFRTNERLQKALELKLFEDQKDSIKLTSLVSQVIDKDTQEKIDVVKNRLIRNHGYCEICATDVLNFVASIFARGDAKE
jgi:serine protein kinase